MKRYSFTGDLFPSLKGKKHSLSIVAISPPNPPHLATQHSIIQETQALPYQEAAHFI